MKEIVHSALVADIQSAIEAADMTKTEFGRIAINDPCLVTDLKNGRELRFATLRRVEAAIAKVRKGEVTA